MNIAELYSGIPRRFGSDLKKNFPETSNYEQLLVCRKFGFVHDWNQFVEWLIVWNMNDCSFQPWTKVHEWFKLCYNSRWIIDWGMH